MMSAQLQQSEAAGNRNASPQTVAAASSSPAAAAVAAAAAGHSAPTQAARGGASTMRNRAGDSKSPFVRAHADTLVSWQLLDDEAVERAKRENKLIFMTIGYLASHYCYLARQESFSNPKISSILNEHFVPVVVDREERPDIDNIYMNYNHSLNNGGGWPLNLFLTPELEPVFGGTYWTGPGVRQGAEAGGPDEPLDFLVILEKLRDVWPAEEPRVREEAKKSVIDLRQYSGEGTLSGDEPDEVDLDQIEEAYTRIGGTFDPMFGGFGQEPKFPTTAKLSFLLRATRFPTAVRDVVGSHDCEYVSTMAIHTLRRMVLGGMHDHAGGGFHRHSVTRDWSLPTFEKTLADNSLLLGLYLDAWLLSGGEKDDEFYDTVLEIADYITSSPILSDKGGFITSEAADSYHRKGDKVKRQGAYYLWTRKEFNTVIGDEQQSKVAATYFDVQEHGNVDPSRDPNDEFLNQNVLRIVKNEARLSKQFGLSEQSLKTLIDGVKRKLRAHRQRERVQPDLDTKIVTAYNGMAIAALARTAAALPPADREGALSGTAQKYLGAAQNAARFIERELWDDGVGVLYRAFSSEGGRIAIEGFAEDYAFLIEGLLELYEATADEAWLRWARRLQEQQLAFFYDEPKSAAAVAAAADGAGAGAHAHARCGAFYSTRLGAPHAILRIKDAMDGAQPSANAVSASNLFRLGGLLAGAGAADDARRYTGLAEQSVRAFGVEMLEHPHLFPGLLCGVVPLKLGGWHWTALLDDDAGPGAGATKASSSSAAAAAASQQLRKAREVFYRAPRAGLFTLSFVQRGGADQQTQQQKAAAKKEEKPPKTDETTAALSALSAPGVYAFDRVAGTYSRIEDDSAPLRAAKVGRGYYSRSMTGA